MTERKQQNSLLVLATLGVYLGLVLVGATPQVLAQAAMTREFNVKDEIEVKDDFDKKPDDNEPSTVTGSVQLYLEDIEYFLASLGRLKSKGTFDPNTDTFDVAQSNLLPCIPNNKTGRYTPLRFITSNESGRSSLVYFSREMDYGYSLGDCVQNTEFGDVLAADSKFSFQLDKTEFLVNITVKKQSPVRAVELLREFQTALQLYSTNDCSKVCQKIIENTVLRIDSDQVFIITRLPRAGLDALLATDAK